MKRHSTFVLSFIVLVVLSAGGANAQVGRTACADFSGLAVGRHQLPMKFPAPAARGYILVVSDFWPDLNITYAGRYGVGAYSENLRFAFFSDYDVLFESKELRISYVSLEGDDHVWPWLTDLLLIRIGKYSQGYNLPNRPYEMTNRSVTMSDGRVFTHALVGNEKAIKSICLKR